MAYPVVRVPALGARRNLTVLWESRGVYSDDLPEHLQNLARFSMTLLDVLLGVDQVIVYSYFKGAAA